MRRILLIDDDEHLAAPLAAYLARFDVRLEWAARPSEGLQRLRAEAAAGTGFDAAILDVMLPEMDGFELCRRLRAESDIPLLMLTARGDVMDRVVGLELGADDYLPKPFEPRELLARLQTVLRRARAPAPAAPPPHAGAGAAGAGTGTPGTSPPAHVLAFDGLQVDLDRREVLRAGERVELTGTEFELLALLAREPRKVFNRDEILERLRGRAAEDLQTRAVDILVSRLRRKLEPLDCIRTLRNVGYAFAAGQA